MPWYFAMSENRPIIPSYEVAQKELDEAHTAQEITSAISICTSALVRDLLIEDDDERE